MFTCSRLGLAGALLSVCGAAVAQGLDGSWSAHVERDGEEFVYEVNLDHADGHLIGNWSMDARRPAFGCLSGARGRNRVRFRTCIVDGSVGSRDSDGVCPDYAPERNRFVLKGSKLVWESWDDQGRSWHQFLLLARKGP